MKLFSSSLLTALVTLLCNGSAAAMAPAPPPLETVAHVDLQRYLGRWYEIARYPNRFQQGCQDSRADYSQRENGEIEVLNSCRDTESGAVRQAKGRAWVVDSASNAKLKVSFFWPFRGDYWIIELGSDYEYAVVGTPDRNYFWILSRSPQMPDQLYNQILQRAEQQGFLPARVIKTAASASDALSPAQL
jgi:apolipoprotein D and lipocalin family protein